MFKQYGNGTMSSHEPRSALPEWLRNAWAGAARLLPVVTSWLLKGVFLLRDLVARHPLTAVGAMLGFLVGSMVARIPLIDILTLGMAPCIGAIVGGYLGWKYEHRR